jgi:hypothetical protein
MQEVYQQATEPRHLNTVNRASFSGFRFRQRDVEHLIRLAESFKGNDFPNTDPDTGDLTMTGYIPRVNNLATFGWTFLAVFHTIQSAVRMLTSRYMIFTTWYPFDASVSPRYELINLSQVQTASCMQLPESTSNICNPWNCLRLMCTMNGTVSVPHVS